jgi:hypothetical protein
MIFNVTAITPHHGLIIRDPSQAGLILAGYEPHWPWPLRPLTGGFRTLQMACISLPPLSTVTHCRSGRPMNWIGHDMKRTMLAATVALAVSTAASAPAFGFHCPRDMKKIDDTLATKHHWMRSTSVSGSQLARIKALRADGERLHQSGKHEEAVEALAGAMKILGIE